ncbi:hypothetical protein EOD39_15504 [Acipenser ruthenus]|uniref:Uncharacterized protein n=1 Tax=Acipenser ruthenus TaxID=7906 RepID=A0A444V818_ACIRT|nr:hypothetical protein EOD39_15504 [Acipenser ruthenus]
MGGIHSWLTSNLQRECCSLSPRSISLVLFALTTNGKCHRLKAVFATVVLSVAGSASLRPALGAHWSRLLALGSSLQPDRLGEQLEVSLVTWLTSPQSCRECGPGRRSGTLNTIILNSSTLSRKSADCRSLSIRASAEAHQQIQALHLLPGLGHAGLGEELLLLTHLPGRPPHTPPGLPGSS